jgi:hypothetical protein
MSYGPSVKTPDLLPLGVKATDIAMNQPLHAVVDEQYCRLDILPANSLVYRISENSAGDALTGSLPGMLGLPLFNSFRSPRQPPHGSLLGCADVRPVRP